MAKKKTKPATTELHTLVGNIKARLKKVDDYRVSAAILLYEARALVEQGDAGEGVKWSEWAPKQFGIGYREIKRLTHIGGAPSPEAAMEDYRQAEATRMKELRASRKVAAVAPPSEAEPPEFNEEDFVVEEDVDGVEAVPEDASEAEAERLRIWNITIRHFMSFTPDRRRQFVRWAAGLCADPGDDAADDDPLKLPSFLRRT